MRRTLTVLIATASAIVITLGLAGVAFANEGPHGGYGAGGSTNTQWNSTDGCAGCHRAHTGQDHDLLTYPEITALCESCHSGAVGAKTDVWAGQWMGTNPGPLNGGGFHLAQNVVKGAGYDPVTSVHAVKGITMPDGSIASGTGTAYGGGNPATASIGVSGVLECTSCHNPHGSQNYRILNGKSGRTAYNVKWTDGEDATWQAVNALASTAELSNTTSAVSPESTHKYANGNSVAYDRGVSDFCATCHTNYVRGFAGTRSDGQDYDVYGDGAVKVWRHAVSMKSAWDYTQGKWDTAVGTYASRSAGTSTTPATPNATDLRRVMADGYYQNGSGLTCLTCHFAHGSSATSSATYQLSDQKLTTGSALLYLDNRGVCQECHDKGTGK